MLEFYKYNSSLHTRAVWIKDFKMYQYGAINTGREDDNEPDLKSPLTNKLRCFLSTWGRRYCRTHKCIASKAALLVIVWSFITTLLYYHLYHSLDMEVYNITKDSSHLSHFGIKAVTFLLFPLAGFLADNKFGRFNVMIVNLGLMVVAFLLLSFLLLFLNEMHLDFYIVNGVMCLFSLVPFIFVNANIIQFGLDQLHDSPADHQSLFIHWHVCVWFAGSSVSKLQVKLGSVYSTLSLNMAAVVLLLLTLMLAIYKKKWFLMNSAQINPYKLVYRVTRFACKHTTPLMRSAFTYCEDDIPSGLDLGKRKYGGPYTTEQVEDVKTFYEILKIIVATGPSFILATASKTSIILSHVRVSGYPTIIETVLLEKGLLSPLLSVLQIPVYVCLIRPFVHLHIPRMLTRTGIGMALLLLSLLCELAMVSTIQTKYGSPVNCRSRNESSGALFVQLNSSELATEHYFLAANGFIISLSDLLLTVALYEFICSQSPHSMKGLLIGLTFASQGIFQGVGTVVIVPFLIADNQPFFRCWMYFYLVSIGLGAVFVAVYMCVARTYRFRQRDELCHIYRYAEEYYSKFEAENLH